MTISLIAAHTSNLGIGYKNDLPWGRSLKKDLQWFQKQTNNHIIVMGRTTFESIGKPLSNRINVVLTRNPELINPKYPVDIISSVQEFFDRFSNLTSEQFIIGGEETYKQFLPYADKLYITEVDGVYEADTFFPEYDPKEWELLSTLNTIDNGVNLAFKVYKRSL